MLQGDELKCQVSGNRPQVISTWVETRHVAYTYYRTGHAGNITIKDAADPTYRDLALYNDVQGRVVIALWDSWQKDGSGNPVNYTRIKARQFRYDHAAPGIARQRHLTHELDPAALPTITALASPMGQWTLYDGSEAVIFADIMTILTNFGLGCR